MPRHGAISVRNLSKSSPRPCVRSSACSIISASADTSHASLDLNASLEQIEEGVRDVLVDEALARSRGSKHGAARLLEITRQRLQHILRKRS
jgi:hypothetical protein